MKLDPPPHFLNISIIVVLNTAKCPQNQDENDGMSSVIITYVYEIALEKTVDENFCEPCVTHRHFPNIASTNALNTAK